MCVLVTPDAVLAFPNDERFDASEVLELVGIALEYRRQQVVLTATV